MLKRNLKLDTVAIKIVLFLTNNQQIRSCGVCNLAEKVEVKLQKLLFLYIYKHIKIQ